MVDTSDKIAAHCGHCGDGIPYEKRYFHCLHCKIRFCNQCHGRHPSDHIPYCKRQVSKSTPHGPPLMDEDCIVCMKTMHTGYQCKECEFRLCIDCFLDSDEIKNHNHKLIILIHPPGEFAVESVNTSCYTCKTSSTMIHCGRCLKGIEKGQNAHECITCLKKYESTIVVCDECLPISRSEHDTAHVYASFLYRLDETVPETHFKLRCLECGAGRNSLSCQHLYPADVMCQCLEFEHCDTPTITKHPHRSFELVMGKRETESMGYRSYRGCEMKAPAAIEDQSKNLEAEQKCLCCKRICKWGEENWYCLDCDNLACNQCKTSGLLNHPHELEKCTFKENPAPDDFYKSVVQTPQWKCDSCEGTFFYNCARYLHCQGCNNYDYCIDCLATKLPLVGHRSCSIDSGWEFRWTPAAQYSNKEWCDSQLAKAKEYAEMLETYAAAEEEAERIEQDSRRLEQENRELQAKTEALRQENARMLQQQQQQQQQQQRNTQSSTASTVRPQQAQRAPASIISRARPASTVQTARPVSNVQRQQDKARRENLFGKVAVSTISAFTKLALNNDNNAWQNADSSNNYS